MQAKDVKQRTNNTPSVMYLIDCLHNSRMLTGFQEENNRFTNRFFRRSVFETNAIVKQHQQMPNHTAGVGASDSNKPIADFLAKLDAHFVCNSLRNRHRCVVKSMSDNDETQTRNNEIAKGDRRRDEVACSQ
jgi:hypothetical protein